MSADGFAGALGSGEEEYAEHCTTCGVGYYTETDQGVECTNCHALPIAPTDDREAQAVHDHSGPDFRCEACKPLTDVLRARMRWASVHWGDLHDDAWPSLARAVHDSDWLAARERAAAEKARADERERIAQAIGAERERWTTETATGRARHDAYNTAECIARSQP